VPDFCEVAREIKITKMAMNTEKNVEKFILLLEKDYKRKSNILSIKEI
jgi:hypothetical protein